MRHGWVRRSAAAALLAVLGVLVSLSAPAFADSSSSNSGPATIADYLKKPGDEVVTVPDGHYTGDTVVAPHPETNGPYKGWLILVAQDPHQVVVDMSSKPLTLAAGTSRIMFVGFAFAGSRLNIEGQDIKFWYTDHTAPDYGVITSTTEAPRMVLVQNAARITFDGSDFHDGNASVVTVNWSDDVTLQGVHMWNVGERPGTDPDDLSHANDVCSLAGGVKNLSVLDSFLEGERINMQAVDGDVAGFSVERTWYTGAAGTAFQFHVYEGRSLQGERVDVHSWGQSGRNPSDRVDTVDGQTVPPNSDPKRLNVTDTNVSLEAPAAGTPDPSQTWRAVHSFGTWRGEVGLSEPSGQSPVLWIALAGVAVVAVALTGLVLMRRAHGRAAMAVGTGT